MYQLTVNYDCGSRKVLNIISFDRAIELLELYYDWLLHVTGFSIEFIG